MNYYKIKYENGDIKIASGESTLDVVRKYDLATKENDNARISKLEGEQLSIAIANHQSY